MTDPHRATVTSVERAGPFTDRFDVHLDGEFAFTIPREVVEDLALAPGRQVDQGEIDAARNAEAEWRSMDTALRLLSHRPRTEAELRTRLRRKGIPPPAIDRCIGELLRQRLLDDHAFACAFVRDRSRSRPRGPTALLAELRARGIDEETAAAALKEVWADDEIAEMDLARRAAARFVPRRNEAPLAARRRLVGLLGRKGFSMDVIRTIVEEHEADRDS